MMGTYVGKMALFTLKSGIEISETVPENAFLLSPTGHHNLSYILDNDYGRYRIVTLLFLLHKKNKKTLRMIDIHKPQI